MKIVTFVFACMAWIECTISPNVPIEDAAYTASMINTLAGRTVAFESSHRHGSEPEIRNNDYITIYKVINGQFQRKDIVGGRFIGPTTRENTHRALGEMQLRANLRGEIEVELGHVNFFYRAFLVNTLGHVDSGHVGRVEYFCTIQTGKLIHLVALLRPSGEHHVPEGVPQVKYANERYRTPGNNYFFTGQLYAATLQNVLMLAHTLPA